MAGVDWVLLVIVTGSALLGLLRGFVGAAASLVAWGLGGWAAFRFGGGMALMLARDGDPSAGQLFAGYALSFLGVLVVVGVAGWLIGQAVKSVGLTGVDRALGLALGTARGVLVASALVLLLGLSSLPREPQWQASQVVPLFVPGAQWLSGWLPGWVAAQVDYGTGAQAAARGHGQGGGRSDDSSQEYHGPSDRIDNGPALPVPTGG